MARLNDQELKDLLLELDESDHRVSEWEASFLDNVAFKAGRMTPAQRKVAIDLLEKYGYI